MKQKTKTWLIAIAVFLAYVVIAIGVSIALALHGGVLWGVVVGLIVAGLISAWLVYRFLRSDEPPPPSGPPAGSPEAILAAARAQLVTARHVVNPKFGSLPVLLVMGPENSAKTTTVVRSGLDPELLAGDVFRGETVAPTEAINTWYAQNTVIVEAGGRYINDPPAWSRLIKALRPRSLSAALTGRAQPPRLAVVCFPCDEFYRPGSGETVPAAARAIRARLGEAAKAFGVQLPTYVVFTKLDSIAYFEAYVRNLSDEEAREPLGAGALPDDGGAGTYADRVTPRLERTFEELYASLAERRVAALSREHAVEFKPGAYEFPREFAKLKPLAVDFVREIGRPSELEVSPVLRGFYFTGVQAVFVAPPAQENVAAVAAAARPAAAARSATAVFTPPVAGVVASPIAAPTPSGPARKVPRWDFLPRLLREAVFGDAAAIKVTAAGARVGFLRRLGLGVASAAALVLLIAFVVSYSGNRKLETAAVDAARGLATPAPNNVDLPPLDALQRLEALRTKVDTLSLYEHQGPPLRLRWGLYAGDRLYPEVRRAYFGGFDKLMFANTRAGIRAALAALPPQPAPTDDYGATYALLKGYIITTTHPEKSTADFLSPLLMSRWLAGRPIDSARAPLARRQFETYANELRFANPFPDTADRATVDHARAFLRGFAGSERIYQFILAEAAKTNPAIQFNRLIPGSAQWVNDSYEVPGAFTKGGAAFVTTALKGVDKYLKGEAWVVGEEVGQIDQNKLVADLRDKYTTDYIEHWRQFLANASLVRYASVKDAAAKLTAISGNSSPLLALFSIASQNTDPAGFPEVKQAFQPVQAVTPPAVTDKLIGPQNAPYMTALLGLQGSLDKVAAAAGPAADAAIAEAGTAAANAKTAALQIANTFTPNATSHAHETVQKLMLAPIANVEPMLRNFGATAINNGARALCAAVAPVLRKYPFASDATQQTTFAEVNDVFKPNTGRLWQFYQTTLAGIIPLQGTSYVATPGAVRISPRFVTLLNKAKAFSEAVYANDSPEPRLTMQVTPQASEQFPVVAINLDGMLMRSTRNGNSESARVTWPGSGHEAKLSANIGPQEYTIAGPYTGQWAVFQLFNQADEWTPQANGYRVGWELRTSAQRTVSATGVSAKATVQVDVPASVMQIFRRGFFNGAECGSSIAQ
jgi:type VI secretion system protein ImpL